MPCMCFSELHWGFGLFFAFLLWPGSNASPSFCLWHVLISAYFSLQQTTEDSPALHLSNGPGQEPVTIMTFNLTKITKYDIDLIL